MKILQGLGLGLVLVISVNAQKAVLSGTVYYAGKYKVENAKIQVKTSKKKTFETKTDKNGEYKLKLLPGIYEITFEHCSIETETYKLDIKKGQKLEIDIKQTTLIVDGCGMTNESLIETPKPSIQKTIIKRKNNK